MLGLRLLIFLKVEITEDQTSPDQLREAFRGIAKDKVSGAPHFLLSRPCAEPSLRSRLSRSWICGLRTYHLRRLNTCAKPCRVAEMKQERQNMTTKSLLIKYLPRPL